MVAPHVRRLGPLALLSAVLAGCSGVPSSRLEQCRNRSLALQAETSRLKDESLKLRSRNRELARRAVEDSERMRTLEEAQAQLEQSVVAYQQERDELAASFERLERALRAAADPPPRASLDRFETFAQAHPGCRIDAQRGAWVFPAGLLFEPGTAELTPSAELLLDAFARLLDDPRSPLAPAAITGRPSSSPIRLTGGSEAGETSLLDGQRATRLRDRLAKALRVETDSIPLVVAPPSDETSTIEVLLTPRLDGPAASDSGA